MKDTSTDENVNLQEIKYIIKKEVNSIFKLPPSERNKAIKRLYLKWHPDKNLGNPTIIAEEEFKFLIQELERSERLATEHRGYAPSSSWSNYRQSWDDTAQNHRRNQQYYSRQQDGGRGTWNDGDECDGGNDGWGEGSRRRGGGGGGGGRGRYHSGFFGGGGFTPPKQESEGRRWIAQAKVDFRALETLMINVKRDDLACNVCFMAHEVAEKALKGAMYAICGLGDVSLKSHQIEPLAHALESFSPKAIGLVALVCGLEPYYLSTRFPNLCSPPSIPANNFTLRHAEDARERARHILDIVNNLFTLAQ